MNKNFDRVFRQRRLSADEVARDEEIRRKVRAEFPPATPSGSASGPLSQALKDALRTSDKSMHQIAQQSGVSETVVLRFLSGERDIRMATADKLAAALGLKLASAS
jgi:ribosome-binding protein aMBF1 (putative translation factor)